MTLDTPEAIDFFALASLKGSVKLEMAGMRFKIGRSAYAKKVFGLPKSWRRAQVFEFLQAVVDMRSGKTEFNLTPAVAKVFVNYVNKGIDNE